ncbi:MAG: sugar phosphate isomerase/epimerase [Phycisphaerales bacterium]|nr:MAG: sugar phosphate isomerase/epimerase [Phycisphaerales bacterium]
MASDEKGISRRDLLVNGTRAGACIGMAAALSSCKMLQSDSPAGRKPKMRFGLTTYQWAKEWDVETLLDYCEKAAVYGVELRTSLSYAHGVELNLDAQQRREVKRRFADSPVTLVGLATSERFDSPDQDKLKTAIENAKAYMKLNHDVGGSGVRVFPNAFQKGVDRQQTIRQIAVSLNIVGSYAADYGQQVRLEAHGNAGELSTIKAIMDLVTSPSVRVKLNSDKRDTKGQGLRYNFNLVKDRLGSTIHVHDFSDPGFPYQKLVDLLAEANWSGWALLERSDKVRNPVEALSEQRQIWDDMVKSSLRRKA